MQYITPVKNTEHFKSEFDVHVTVHRNIVKVKNQLNATKYAVLTAYFVASSWFFTFTMQSMQF
jgi:hypothetical protein